MSPAGIPMFYAAFDEITAIAEIIDLGKTADLITIAQFKNISKLTLIDFTKLEYISLFDNEKRSLRDEYFFLNDFTRDLSGPVSNDGSQHIEYVPTQVVTEYFKHVFPSVIGKEIHGMIYPSAKVKGGKCLVLFFNQEQIFGPDKSAKYISLMPLTFKSHFVSKIKLKIVL